MKQRGKGLFIVSIEIYYFTGTGNSLAIARDIVDQTQGTVISMASVIHQEQIHSEAETMGMVFPCYLAQRYGIPLIVEKFIKNVDDLGAKYLFAVCTCGGWELVNALPTLQRLGHIIKQHGGTLTAEFSIHLPMNNLTYPSPLIDQNQARMFERAQAKIDDICRRIVNKERNAHHALKTLFNTGMLPLYGLLQHLYVNHLKKMAQEPRDTTLTYSELIHWSDKSIVVTDRCTGCGTCARVCPVQNIEIIDQKPVWKHQCEMCLACDEWCPQRAIRHWCKTEGKDYHHPRVTLADMLAQRGD